MHNVLFLGLGSIGECHLRCFLETGRIESWVCETLDTRREEVVSRYKVSHVYPDFDAVFDKLPDIAVIAVPAHLHVSMATRLAEAGVHVFIEKPLSTSLEGVERLQRVIEDRQLRSAVLYTFRAGPALRAMRDAIRTGRFGRPIQLVCTSGQHFPHYRPAYRDIYYVDHETGGGAIQDAMTHMVNAAEWFLGPVQSLVTDAEHNVLEGVTVEDTVHMMTRHQIGMGSLSLNQFQVPNEMVFTVHCEKGSARCQPTLNRWYWMDQVGDTWTEEDLGTIKRDDLYVNQANLLLDYYEGLPDAPPCSIKEGIQTLRVNLASLQSAANAEKFVFLDENEK